MRTYYLIDGEVTTKAPVSYFPSIKEVKAESKAEAIRLFLCSIPHLCQAPLVRVDRGVVLVARPILFGQWSCESGRIGGSACMIEEASTWYNARDCKGFSYYTSKEYRDLVKEPMVTPQSFDLK